MKNLLLMRHGKSSWKNENLTDHERPLKKRGRKDSRLMAMEIENRDIIPDLILASTAQRTRETVEVIINTLFHNIGLIYSDELYMGGPQDFINVLKQQAKDYSTVMIVAHNPGLAIFLDTYSEVFEDLPTAALGHLTLAIDDWKDISLETTGELTAFWTPKKLKSKN